MSFRKLCHMTFRKLIPPFTLSGFGQDAFFKKKNVCSSRITFFRLDDDHFISMYSLWLSFIQKRKFLRKSLNKLRENRKK